MKQPHPAQPASTLLSSPPVPDGPPVRAVGVPDAVRVPAPGRAPGPDPGPEPPGGRAAADAAPPDEEPPHPPPPGRLTGVDLARYLAIAGMLVIHFGVPFLEADRPTAAIVFTYAWGRSTILFAFLAGVSLALASGGARPHRGRRARTTAARVAVRGACLLVIGWLLHAVITAGQSNLTVIITFYGLYFLLALPFLRLPARWAATAAAAALAAGPQLLFLLRRSNDTGGAVSAFTEAWNGRDPAHLLLGQGMLELGVYGYYPALAYLGAVLAGLAVGRLDLRSRVVRLRLALGGALLAAVAYRVSWHAWYNYGLYDALGPREEVIGSIPTDDARWLLTSMPHTSTSVEVAGGVGVAACILAGCLWAAERLPRLLEPFTAAGAMALSVYAVHALAMAWQAWLPDHFVGLAGAVDAHMAEVFFIASLIGAFLWRRLVGRGPLEATVSTLAQAAAPGPRTGAHARPKG
ncbi:heparan-alpha-glucosaminide N-acetyltransferase domain-containing protein [Nocardiopsis sp. RSe5-2]|uniref:Heparan-alpha-glucosaminide N-acetyltransferase domain-containing protein n=1 Tax=Nocardiopsis endophytica TaxID=3018445 RepID=A0ABT4U4F1_9ACTN|nr:heparan-alpha-glucosaminide N-acetyltransferase domain-containing protein [Nocardiopsis endophytica]MDA2811823.1 heparan-alpha-glucosaminide N-acetyltransferase domain-containing protein [Nocardiopsis endophytica]